MTRPVTAHRVRSRQAPDRRTTHDPVRRPAAAPDSIATGEPPLRPPEPLYVWTLLPRRSCGAPEGPGAGGVTDDLGRALAGSTGALRGVSGGTVAAVYQVALSLTRLAYVYQAVMAVAWYEPCGRLVLDMPVRPRRWDLPVLTREGVVLPPPEAIAAALADLKADCERGR